MATPTLNISQATYNAVEPYAKQYGVPDEVWMSVASVESGGNPNATNPSGAYGLFQLLVGGGQGDAAINAGYTKQQLLDPGINAKFAMPAIATAYKQIFASTPGHPNQSYDDANAWIQFASVSGHPGGSTTNSYTRSVGLLLADAFGMISAKKLAAGYQNAFQNYNNVDQNTQNIDNTVSNAISTVGNAANVISFLQGLTTGNVKNALIKIGLFLVAVTLLVIGFIVVTKEPQQKGTIPE